jgi:hypothetical protein
MRRVIVGLMIGLALGFVAPVHAVTTTTNLTVQQRLTRLENEVSVLKLKTSKLTKTGHYKGPVAGSQVNPLASGPSCGGTDTAVWEYGSTGAFGISC